MSDYGDVVTPESPWLGLRSFSEDARGYFFGRDAELDDLYERVLHRPLTVFFGQSGLGKTSLLRAGLVPRLRDTGFLPVVLRLGWSENDPAPEEQVLTELRAALNAASDARWRTAADFPAGLTLWQLLHDRARGFLPTSGTPASPRVVLLFDQFEEIFTLGQRRRADADSWRDTLAALVENRPPSGLRTQLQENPSLIDQLDLRVVPAKFVLTLRDDFLHILERWRRTMPSVFDNRFELKHLNGREALQAVVYPGRMRANKPPIVDEATGTEIVRFVAGVSAEKPLREIEAVPPLLSLVCAELNVQRLKFGIDRIIFSPFVDEPAAIRDYFERLPLNAEGRRDPVAQNAMEQALITKGLSQGEIRASLMRLAAKGLLSRSDDDGIERVHLSPGLVEFAGRTGRDILQTFYDGCFIGMDERVRPWLEDTFLSPEGFRQSVNDDTALGGLARAGLNEADAAAVLDALVTRRVLTSEEHGEIRRFELTHDILAPIVRDSRDARRKREAEEAAKRKAQEAEDAAKAQELYLLSTRGLSTERSTIRPPSGLADFVSDKWTAGKGIALSDYFWDDLLEYIAEGSVIPIIGRELVTIEVDGRTVSLSRYLAERIGARLGVSTGSSADDYSLSDVMSSLIERGDSRIEIIYSQISASFKGLTLRPPESLRRLADIAAFNLFVTLTFDPLLVNAIDEVRYGGSHRTEEIAYSPRRSGDLAAERPESSVYYLFGRLSPIPDYVVSDEDMLEFVYSLQAESRRPQRLFDRLANSQLLMLGCSLPDWVTRFFIRMTRPPRLLSSPYRVLIVDSQTASDRNFQQFARHFNTNAQVIPATAAEFVDEMHRRVKASLPAMPMPPDAARRDAVMSRDAVYVSYAHEDEVYATLIREALESMGITVWSPTQRVAPADDWDREIRRNIADCIFFVPLISRSTESRAEGFFRREWSWAAERALGLSETAKFIVPVIVDDTPDPVVNVPEAFRQINSVRLVDGRVTTEVFERFKYLVRAHRLRSASS
jgi:conflict system STAND superfamily ATPase/TIR domain-containing protein/SIR2-like protein